MTVKQRNISSNELLTIDVNLGQIINKQINRPIVLPKKHFQSHPNFSVFGGFLAYVTALTLIKVKLIDLQNNLRNLSGECYCKVVQTQFIYAIKSSIGLHSLGWQIVVTIVIAYLSFLN